MSNEIDNETLARIFHKAYERLAPQFGYETRRDTREFDPSTPNGRLMIAVCGEVRRALRSADLVPAQRLREAEARAYRMEAALHWYAERIPQSIDYRTHAGRELADDGGRKAREALAPQDDTEMSDGERAEALRDVERLRDELYDLRTCENCGRETGAEVPETMICVRCWNRMSRRMERAEARAEWLEAALQFIAEEHDAGRHDGLPESCPAHDEYVMWEAAREALAPQPERNQCDGCARGLPIDEHGIHRGEGYDVIVCTADRYAHGDDHE